MGKTWVKTGVVCGLLACIIFPLATQVGMSFHVNCFLFFAFEPLLCVASIGLYHFLNLSSNQVQYTCDDENLSIVFPLFEPFERGPSTVEEVIMSIIGKFFGATPFKFVAEHTKKVHECVKLLQPLTEALLAEDFDTIEELHNRMSKTEHEADQIKNQLRDDISRVYILSVEKGELKRFIQMQDAVADAAEDYCVVLILRRTRVPDALKEDFSAFVAQVIHVSDELLRVAEELSLLAEVAFTGEEADRVLEAIDKISYEEWQADRLQRKLARNVYDLEESLDPITLIFLDKYCQTLGEVANAAERAAKYLHGMIAP